MGVYFETYIGPKEPVDLNRAQFIALARDLVENEIFALPATLIGGSLPLSGAYEMQDRAEGLEDKPGAILARADDLTLLLSALEKAPYGEQDLCVVFNNFHPLLRGLDPDEPEWFDPNAGHPTASVALFALASPQVYSFSLAAVDDKGYYRFDEDGELVEEDYERPLQHFLALYARGENGEDEKQMLAALERAYGPLQANSNAY